MSSLPFSAASFNAASAPSTPTFLSIFLQALDSIISLITLLSLVTNVLLNLPPETNSSLLSLTAFHTLDPVELSRPLAAFLAKFSVISEPVLDPPMFLSMN